MLRLLSSLPYRRMEKAAGLAGETYTSGTAGKLAKAAQVLLIGGGSLAAVTRRSRLGSALAGIALMAGACCERFAVFEAGQASAATPNTPSCRNARGLSAWLTRGIAVDRSGSACRIATRSRTGPLKRQNRPFEHPLAVLHVDQAAGADLAMIASCRLPRAACRSWCPNRLRDGLRSRRRRSGRGRSEP